MESAGPKLSVWTEGLDEEWQALPGGHARLNRGSMTPDRILKSLETIRFLNNDRVECQLILQHRKTQLLLLLANGKIFASDPQDPNYQNIPIELPAVAPYLEEHFALTEAFAQTGPNPVRIIEWILLAVFLGVLGFTVFYVGRFLSHETGFLPWPAAVEFRDAASIREYRQAHAGLYLTRLEDGGMAIELEGGGTYGYYDLTRRPDGGWRLVPVDQGLYRPVLISGKLAMLTDNRFVFQISGEGELEFLQRRFSWEAANRASLPGLSVAE